MRENGYDSYAKSWTSKFDDGWYLSLKLHERGLWDQLCTWAKRAGDTGVVTFSSWAHAGQIFGCDGRTCRRIILKMEEEGKLHVSDMSQARAEHNSRKNAGLMYDSCSPDASPSENPCKFVEIQIVNYIKNQHDSGGRPRKPTAQVLQNSLPTEEREKRTEERESTPPHGHKHNLWSLEYFGKEHGDYLGLLVKGPGWAEWCEMFVDRFGRERIEEATPFIVEYLKEVRRKQARMFPVDTLRGIVWDRVEGFVNPGNSREDEMKRIRELVENG